MKLSQLGGEAKRWLKSTVIGAVTSVVLAFMVYLATGRNGDLIAWPSEQTLIYPTERTKNLALPLLLSQTPVKSVTFIDLNVSNAGKSTIGGQEKPWTFQITGPPEATLALVGEPHRSSNRLPMWPAVSSAPNVIAVQVGSLEPREFFDIRFIVVNASRPSNPHLEIDTNLQGLPHPILTGTATQERIAQRLAPWLWIALFALLMYEAIRDRHAPEKGPKMWQTVKDWRLRLIGRTLLSIFLSAVTTYAVAQAIAWTVVRLWRLGLLS